MPPGATPPTVPLDGPPVFDEFDRAAFDEAALLEATTPPGDGDRDGDGDGELSEDG